MDTQVNQAEQFNQDNKIDDNFGLWITYIALDRADTALRDQLIAIYLPIAQRYAGSPDNYADAYDALLDSIEKYDPRASTAKFSSYLYPRVRGRIIDSYRKRDSFFNNSQRKQKKINDAKNILMEKLGRQPTQQEIEDEASISPSGFVRYPSITTLSPVSGQSGATENKNKISDEIKSPATELDASDFLRVEKFNHLTRTLNLDEKIILYLIFYKNYTQKEVSQIMRLSACRVSEIVIRSKEQMKKLNTPDDFVD